MRESRDRLRVRCGCARNTAAVTAPVSNQAVEQESDVQLLTLHCGEHACTSLLGEDVQLPAAGWWDPGASGWGVPAPRNLEWPAFGTEDEQRNAVVELLRGHLARLRGFPLPAIEAPAQAATEVEKTCA